MARFEELRKRLEEIRALNRRIQEGVTTPSSVQAGPASPASSKTTATPSPEATPSSVSRIEELRERARQIFEEMRSRRQRRTTTLAAQSAPAPQLLPPAPPAGVTPPTTQRQTPTFERGITLDEALAKYGAKEIFPTKSAYFGALRVREDGSIVQHTGIDFYLPKGTPLGAIADGVVDYAGYDKVLGYFVRLKHNNFFTTYGHLHSIPQNIKPGTAVKRGQLIGYVGNTGNAEGMPTHVHFIMRAFNKVGKPGTYIDPSSIFPEFSIASLRVAEK